MQFRRYRRVGTHHEVPDLVPLFAFGLTPCCPEGLGGNLEVDLGGRAKVQIPLGMLVGADSSLMLKDPATWR